jgi:hypothetical protein
VPDRRPEPVHVVEVHVGDRGDAAVPGVGRVEPAAEPDLDDGEVDGLLREPGEDHRGQQLELCRRPEPAGHAVRGPHRSIDQPGERRGVDRYAADLHPLAVRDEVRFRGLASAQPGRP